MSDAKALYAAILLDRSGSMETRWAEALGAVNAYARALADAEVTLATFDGVDGLKFEVIRDRVAPGAWKDVTPSEAGPRGMTPLYDAFARVVALADAAARERTVIVVMTDGAENASREVDRESARSIVERCREKGWQVVFLGADFDAFSQAGGIGVPMGMTLNMKSGGFRSALQRLARRTREFADAAEPSPIEFTDEDRDEAAGK